MYYSAEGPTGSPAAGVAGLGAALVPVPARSAQAYQSWGYIDGQPRATVGAPYPAGVPQGAEYRNAGSPLRTSVDAPAEWHPGIYYQPELASRPPVAIESDNQMPVPARAFTALGAILARTPGILGQRQVGWPLSVPKYAWRA